MGESGSAWRIASYSMGDTRFRANSRNPSSSVKKLIEVKITGLGKFFPFYVSVNEVRCSEDMADQFHLFRVFDIARSPRLYILTGSLRAACHLEPVQFRATI
jgi:hypothetical protein